jgi:hypothetical protein
MGVLRQSIGFDIAFESGETLEVRQARSISANAFVRGKWTVDILADMVPEASMADSLVFPYVVVLSPSCRRAARAHVSRSRNAFKISFPVYILGI